MAVLFLFRARSQRALASPSKTLLVLAFQGCKMGGIILTSSIHQLRKRQRVINLALTPCSSAVTFKIQYSVGQHFLPRPPLCNHEAVTKLFVEQVQCYWHQGTLGDLWHIVELMYLNPISLLLLFPSLFSPFSFVFLNWQVIAWARTTLFAGRSVLEPELILLTTLYY